MLLANHNVAVFVGSIALAVLSLIYAVVITGKAMEDIRRSKKKVSHQ